MAEITNGVGIIYEHYKQVVKHPQNKKQKETAEQQLKVLEETSWIKNIDFNPSVAELHSLTGGKKAKWKFEVKFNEKYLDT